MIHFRAALVGKEAAAEVGASDCQRWPSQKGREAGWLCATQLGTRAWSLKVLPQALRVRGRDWAEGTLWRGPVSHPLLVRACGFLASGCYSIEQEGAHSGPDAPLPKWISLSPQLYNGLCAALPAIGCLDLRALAHFLEWPARPQGGAPSSPVL